MNTKNCISPINFLYFDELNAPRLAAGFFTQKGLADHARIEAEAQKNQIDKMYAEIEMLKAQLDQK